jgi:hypothetical protein
LIVIQNILEMFINPRVWEKWASVLILHELHEYGVDGEADEFAVGIAGRSQAGSVDHLDHVVTSLAAELFLTARDSVLPVEAQDRVRLDQLAEPGYRWQ